MGLYDTLWNYASFLESGISEGTPNGCKSNTKTSQTYYFRKRITLFRANPYAYFFVCF